MPKLAIVTGGSGGIGLEIVKRLSQEMDVLCISRSGFNMQENPTTNTVHNLQGDAGDLSKPNEALDALSAWLEAYPDYHVTYLIHNAAVLELGKTTDLELASYSKALNINVMSPFAITRLIYGSNRFSAQTVDAAEHSAVIYVTSSAAREDKVFESMGLYSGTKAMMNNLASIQCKELASTNIHVHRVYPGIVDTDMQTTLRTDARLADDFRGSVGAVKDLKPGDWKGSGDSAKAPKRISPYLSGRFVVWAANHALNGVHIPDGDIDFYKEEAFHGEGYTDADFKTESVGSASAAADDSASASAAIEDSADGRESLSP